MPISGVATDTPHPGGGPAPLRQHDLPRLPVLQVFRHLLPWPADPHVKSMQRIAVEATLRNAARVLRVTTTHLEYYSPTQRTAQIERLRELHREAVAQARCARPATTSDGPFDGMPRGARGDPFRRLQLLSRLGRARAHARADRRRDAAVSRRVADRARRLAARRDLGLYDKEQWPEPPFTFDFVFVSADLAPRVRDMRVDATTDASDHQPVLLSWVDGAPRKLSEPLHPVSLDAAKLGLAALVPLESCASHCVLLGRFARVEGAEVAALAGFRVDLSRVEPVLPGC